jgi:hypothetical protein
MSDENLNTCNKCGSIQNWATEMYWKGEECMETNEILGDYTAVCDDCYSQLAKEQRESSLMDKYRDVGMSPSDFM